MYINKYFSHHKILLHISLYRKGFIGMHKVICFITITMIFSNRWILVMLACYETYGDIQIITLVVVLCAMLHMYKRSDGTYSLHDIPNYTMTLRDTIIFTIISARISHINVEHNTIASWSLLLQDISYSWTAPSLAMPRVKKINKRE